MQLTKAPLGHRRKNSNIPTLDKLLRQSYRDFA